MKLVAVLVVTVACGGAPKPVAPPAEQGEMANAPPELVKFHDALAPRWHAAKGPERMTATCGAIAELTADADGVAQARPPASGDNQHWNQEAKELTEAVAALKATCDAKDAAKFETAFANVHQEFHELLEAASGPGGMHEEEHEEKKGGY